MITLFKLANLEENYHLWIFALPVNFAVMENRQTEIPASAGLLSHLQLQKMVDFFFLSRSFLSGWLLAKESANKAVSQRELFLLVFLLSIHFWQCLIEQKYIVASRAFQTQTSWSGEELVFRRYLAAHLLSLFLQGQTRGFLPCSVEVLAFLKSVL